MSKLSRILDAIGSVFSTPKTPVAPTKPTPTKPAKSARTDVRAGPVYVAITSDATGATFEVVDDSTTPPSYVFAMNFLPGSDPLIRMRIGGEVREIPVTLIAALLDAAKPEEEPNP